jgi:hypothetical protein
MPMQKKPNNAVLKISPFRQPIHRKIAKKAF